MIHETNEIDMSNAERAKVANDANADVFLRIHANGSEDPDVNGMMTICPTAENPYCSKIYEDSYILSNLKKLLICIRTFAKLHISKSSYLF